MGLGFGSIGLLDKKFEKQEQERVVSIHVLTGQIDLLAQLQKQIQEPQALSPKFIQDRKTRIFDPHDILISYVIPSFGGMNECIHTHIYIFFYSSFFICAIFMIFLLSSQFNILY